MRKKRKIYEYPFLCEVRQINILLFKTNDLIPYLKMIAF